MTMLRLRGDGPVLPESSRAPSQEAPFPQIPSTSHNLAAEDGNARFARIVLPHLGDAYSLARRITGNRRDAEDVVQEACLRAFRAISRSIDGNVRAWVLTVVHNTACSWLRKNHRHACLVGVPDLEATELEQAIVGNVNAETPETALIARMDAEQLEAAISDLPTPFREALVLRDLEGLSYREIAEVTGARLGTVMSRLARGRGRVFEKIVGKTAR
jgi:RNA polymerase sigma-70 factor (ECF subfamily)